MHTKSLATGLLSRAHEHGAEQPEPVFVVAENDLLTICLDMWQPDPERSGGLFDCYAFTTCRIRDGRIAEFWPSASKVARPVCPASGTPSRAVTVSRASDIDIEANKRLVVEF